MGWVFRKERLKDSRFRGNDRKRRIAKGFYIGKD
jgi:hypothetical protein